MLFLKLRTRYKAQLAFYDLNGFMKILDTVWVAQSRTSLKDHMTLTVSLLHWTQYNPCPACYILFLDVWTGWILIRARKRESHNAIVSAFSRN